MPLTDEQKAKVAELAKEWGEDPAELESEAESAMADDEGDGGASGEAKAAESGPNGGKGFYAYQYPFLRVNEVRQSLGLGDAPDGEMFTSQWLAKYGGPTAAPTSDQESEKP